MTSIESNALKTWRQGKIVVPPHLKPKTTLGQKTVYRNHQGAEEVKEYQGLKTEYYRRPSLLQPFLNKVKGRILTNREILGAPTGIYTWILKRGNVHITPLRSNQEIGSLHANINTLTTTNENMGNERIKPSAAGEMLIVRQDDETIHVFFNVQSGTFSEPIFTCRARALGEERGMNKKELRKHMANLRMECRQPFVDEILPILREAIGLPEGKLRFLDCSTEIDEQLKRIPLLEQDFDHGPCKEEDGYFESLAGKHLIRRVRWATPLENRENFNTYFTTELPSSKRKPNQLDPVDPLDPIPLSKKKATTKKGGRSRRKKLSKTVKRR